MCGALRSVGRVAKAIWLLTPVVVTHARDVRRYLFFGGRRKLDRDDRRRRAGRLADAFEELGVTYIKLAQFLTTRPDFVPPIYIAEMQRLQDEVPPESFSRIQEMLEHELGDVDEVFTEFDEEPISSASIAQVHRAEVDGEEVAVKVQRPGLREVIEADLTALHFMVAVLTRGLRTLGHLSHAESLEEIASDLDRRLHEEIDFTREASVMEEIRENTVREGFDSEVVVPETYGEYCTGRVIVMSFEDGTKIKDVDALEAAGHDVEELAERLVEVYLRMAFVYGVYQTDPHHGNLAVDDEGRIIVYDYGLSEKPEEDNTEAFARFFAGIGLGEPDVAVAALEDVGAVEITSTREHDAIRSWVEALAKDARGDVGGVDVDALSEQFDESFEDFPLKLRQDILLGLRTTTGIQGIAAELSPAYDFTSHLTRFFVEQDAFDLDFERIQEDARERSQRVHVDGVRDDVVEEIRRSNRRTVYSVTAATFALGGGLLYTAGLGVLASGAAVAVASALSLKVLASFRRKDDVVGPMFLMRTEMDKWDDEHRTADNVERRRKMEEADEGASEPEGDGEAVEAGEKQETGG